MNIVMALSMEGPPPHEVTLNFMKDYLNEDGLNVMSFTNIMIGLSLNGCQFIIWVVVTFLLKVIVLYFAFLKLRCDVFHFKIPNHIILMLCPYGKSL